MGRLEDRHKMERRLERIQGTHPLEEACGDDESLRRQVESLLAYQSEAKNFIETPAMDWAARALAKDEAPTELIEGATRRPWLPARIGNYRVIRLLGEGGMGVVYEAEQEKPRRIVALKVIKPGIRRMLAPLPS